LNISAPPITTNTSELVLRNASSNDDPDTALKTTGNVPESTDPDRTPLDLTSLHTEVTDAYGSFTLPLSVAVNVIARPSELPLRSVKLRKAIFVYLKCFFQTASYQKL